MPTNYIKITNGATPANSIRKGNVCLGINVAEYGPTSSTGFWCCIEPPVGGYTIYTDKPAQGPSIYVAQDDSDLIEVAKNVGIYQNDAQLIIEDSFTFPRMLIANRTYEDIHTNGLVLAYDPGFTGSTTREGSVIYDISGSGIKADGFGTDWKADAGGNLSFNGLRFMSTSSAVSALNNATEYTVSFWHQMFLVSLNGTLITNADSASTTGWSVTTNSSNFEVIEYTSSGSTTFYAGSVNGGWNQFTFKVDSAGNITFYLNGNQVASGNGFSPDTSSSEITFGRSAVGGDYSIMNLSQMLFYNRCLSDQEILDNYNNLFPRFP